MHLRRAPLVIILILLFQFFGLAFPGSGEERKDKKRIAIVGDLQKTSAIEFLVAREDNDAERSLVINSIKQQKPDVVILLGDMVFDGSDEAEWIDFNTLIRPLRSNQIKIYPVLGNHEYWGYNDKALRNVGNVFPILNKNKWYAVEFDSLGLIFLDSNDGDYSEAEWNRQKKWFEAKLSQYDKDPGIKGVFVFLHHPPYTNSIVTGDAIQVQMTFCPAFVKAKKTITMFSGHAHTYEKFYKDGKYFIVSGGGGGPRVRLKTGFEFHHDLCKLPSPRPFHYVLLEREKDKITFTIKGVDKGLTQFFNVERFTLNFNK